MVMVDIPELRRKTCSAYRIWCTNAFDIVYLAEGYDAARVYYEGIDRIVDITFGFEEHAFHLIAELYGKGNMFLTDAKYTILNLLRPRTDVDQDVRYATHERFPIELVRHVPECLLDLRDPISFENLTKEIYNLLLNASGPWNNGLASDGTELPPVTSLIGSVFSYGTGLIEHCCAAAGITNAKRLKKTESDARFPITDPNAYRLQISEKIATAFREVLIQISEKKNINEDGSITNPAIIVLSSNHGPTSKYEAYYPIRFVQMSSKPTVDFDTFNKAVDEFYSSMEIKKSEVQIIQNVKSANKKIENIKRDQENRLIALRGEQIKDNQKAQLLELNVDLVDRVIMTLNSAIASQTNWKVLEGVIEKQKERGDDPVANCIVKLQLSSNQAILHLSDPYQEDNDEDQHSELPAQDVMVDLDCTALQNAKKYYANRRQAEAKEQKTIAGTKTALKAAARKAEKTKKDVRGVPKMIKARKPFWFEKFHWFISSDNYLVLAGRDAVQNENLIKRYFRQHDIYVHADVHGASSVIVKARHLQPYEKPIMGDTEELSMPQPPLRTLIEAGQMAVALSNAWSAKIITNAWWVRHDQVSKTAPSGEYLTTGSFVIRGRKNMLPQCHLTYGIGILFKLADDSVERHLGERCIDLEAIRDAEAAVKKYEIPETQPDDAEQEEDDDVAKAFENVKLNLSINRVKKPQTQSVKQRQKSAPQAAKCSSFPPSQLQSKAKSSCPNPLKRGQKAKMKKIKERYADQDAEERQIRQQLLQGANAKLSSVHELTKGPKKEEGENEVQGQNAVKQEEESQKDEEEPRNSQEESESTSKTTKFETQHIDNDREDDALLCTAEVPTLETLTGLPTSEDTILYALPFCAPYTALQKYKYKAKLIPGTQKRGKITKLAIHHFTSDKDATDLEKQLIHAIKEEDLCRVMPGSAKITFPSNTVHRE
nr:protein of unknown function DUF814 [Hymenolepis microstoma]